MPGIDNQDLEHQPNEQTRVDNAGVKVPQPQEREPGKISEEEIDARIILREFIEQLNRLPAN